MIEGLKKNFHLQEKVNYPHNNGGKSESDGYRTNL